MISSLPYTCTYRGWFKGSVPFRRYGRFIIAGSHTSCSLIECAIKCSFCESLNLLDYTNLFACVSDVRTQLPTTIFLLSFPRTFGMIKYNRCQNTKMQPLNSKFNAEKQGLLIRAFLVKLVWRGIEPQCCALEQDAAIFLIVLGSGDSVPT